MIISYFNWENKISFDLCKKITNNGNDDIGLFDESIIYGVLIRNMGI